MVQKIGFDLSETGDLMAAIQLVQKASFFQIDFVGLFGYSRYGGIWE